MNIAQIEKNLLKLMNSFSKERMGEYAFKSAQTLDMVTSPLDKMVF